MKIRQPLCRSLQYFLLSSLIAFAAISNANAYVVTGLTAEYHNGQVFLTWKNAIASNLQYNVYRSSSKFTSVSQLNQANFLGFVRDNSGKNVRLSLQENKDIYLKIKDNGQPLASDRGLYVVTCTGNQSFYYTVTVTTLSSNQESKKINPGQNSLLNPVNEIIAKPLPVFQDSVKVSAMDMKYRYVQFVNNQETPLYPAMNSTGSYGFNFFLAKRGSSSAYPLFVVYENEGASSKSGVGLDGEFTDCYIVGFDDWLPIPLANGMIGDNEYWCCYHEDFNIYSNQNTPPVTGVVRTYPQKRYIEGIRWAKEHFPIDASKVYLKGGSSNGYGALLTAALYPEEVSAVYATVEPVSIGPSKVPIYEQMWGVGSAKLKSDVIDPSTGDTLLFNKMGDMRAMLYINQLRELPLIFDVHGKNDHSVGWTVGKIAWLDSLQNNHVGGVFYWDQREHNGDGKNFLNEETMPDFLRYETDKSYPAFSNCSINQDPGIGTKTSGTPYGAINGYLDFEDDIIDEDCNYSINLLIKDFYVGGVLDVEQYFTCTSDVTLRRLQQFHPNNGALVKWKNFDASNTKIQSGSFNYTGGLITLKDIIINKSGNHLELKIANCNREDDIAEAVQSNIYFSRTGNGYTAHIDVSKDQEVSVSLYDLVGHVSLNQTMSLSAGSNDIEIPFTSGGVYLVKIEGTSFLQTTKLFF